MKIKKKCFESNLNRIWSFFFIYFFWFVHHFYMIFLQHFYKVKKNCNICTLLPIILAGWPLYRMLFFNMLAKSLKINKMLMIGNKSLCTFHLKDQVFVQIGTKFNDLNYINEKTANRGVNIIL